MEKPDPRRTDKILDALAVAEFLERLAVSDRDRLPARIRQSWPDGMLGRLYASCCQYAADLGSPDGQYRLGLLHTWGRGVPRDILTANQWLARAGAQGHVEAALRLAEHYHFMEAIWRRRYRRAERAWCAKDAIPGEKFQGFEGIERDYQAAAFWYRIAADRGNAKAALRLGRLLETGKAGLPRDVAEAFILYARAAAAGDESAVTRMGRLSVRRKGKG